MSETRQSVLASERQPASVLEAWNDLYVRTDPSETSPDQGRKGGLGSPDVIPWGTRPVSPDSFTNDPSYAQVYNNSLYQNTPNYIYVRAKNSSQSSDKSGKANLVLTNPAIVIWPGGAGWTRINTSGGSSSSELKAAGSASIKPGKIGVTTDPFEYVPKDFGHRCLVTWLDTVDHPDPGPPPKITTMSELVKFLVEHPNYAHHNVDIAPINTTRVTATKPYTQQDEAETVRFTLATRNCNGFVVGYSCGTEIAPGKFIVLEDTQISSNDIGVYKEFPIPANFQGNISFWYDMKGLSPVDYSVSLQVAPVTQPGHPVYNLCRPPEYFGLQGDGSAKRIYPVGSVTLMPERIAR